ncbi:MAG: allantoinase, partial [Halobacteriaceae archaeon]
MTADTIISGGTLVTSEETIDASVAIQDGKIIAIGKESALPNGDKVIDASGQLVMPGIIDPHVHIDGYLSKDSYAS